MTERLGSAHIQRFLASRPVVVLATVQADGSPLAMPMWFLHDVETLTMISVADTQKVRNLRRDGRVSVVAEAGTGSNLVSVTMQGQAAFLDADAAESRSASEGLLTKYHPYLERRWGGRAMPPDRVMFRIVPARVRSWGLRG